MHVGARARNGAAEPAGCASAIAGSARASESRFPECISHREEGAAGLATDFGSGRTTPGSTFTCACHDRRPVRALQSRTGERDHGVAAGVDPAGGNRADRIARGRRDELPARERGGALQQTVPRLARRRPWRRADRCRRRLERGTGTRALASSSRASSCDATADPARVNSISSASRSTTSAVPPPAPRRRRSRCEVPSDGARATPRPPQRRRPVAPFHLRARPLRCGRRFCGSSLRRPSAIRVDGRDTARRRRARATVWTERFSSPGPAISEVPSVREICAIAGASFCSNCAIRSIQIPARREAGHRRLQLEMRRSSNAPGPMSGSRCGSAGFLERLGARRWQGRAVPSPPRTSICRGRCWRQGASTVPAGRSRTARTNFITASCTRSTSLEVPRSACGRCLPPADPRD